MHINEIPKLIAFEIKIQIRQVEAVLKLLQNDTTGPFITRYRKETTGELNKEHIRDIKQCGSIYTTLLKDKEKSSQL